MKAAPYTDDYTDEISELVEEAHAIFNATTVTEVMDMKDRQSQEDFLNKIYNNPGAEAIDRYLDVVKRLDMVVSSGYLQPPVLFEVISSLYLGPVWEHDILGNLVLP